MNFTHLYESFLQHKFFHCIRPNGSKLKKQELTMSQTLKTHNWTELSWRDTFYKVQVRLKARLDHGFAIEYTYFQ